MSGLHLLSGRKVEKEQKEHKEQIEDTATLNITDQDALDFHSKGKRGKVEISPTKPLTTQMELSLAYSPGVAVPCMEIA